MKFSMDTLDWPPWAAFLFRFARRLVLSAAVLVVLFVLLELLAYHFLPGRSTRFLVEGSSDGQPAWIDNQFFMYRFFPARTAKAPPPIVALKSPPPDALRVCILGGSSAMGMPEPAFGLPRQLELMLESRYPGHPVEVVSMAVDGGNSHVMREAARDLLVLKPHAVVVLLGNEEIAGPYGPASGFGSWNHSSRLARTMAVFSRTRLSQLFVAAFNRLFPARIDLDVWRSEEPISLRGRMAPDDPRLRTAQRSFRKNLSAILDAARIASPAVVVCTVPSNLRDCAPFLTAFLKDEAAAQEVRETLRAAIAADAASNRAEAARLYSGAIRRHPTHAEALFRAAQFALRENRPAEATALFSRARDADALRLRADSSLNAIVRECAVESSASLLDVESLFAIRSPHGIPGRELFLDHAHFTFEGSHLLASAILYRLEFLRAFEAEPTGPIPSAKDLAGEMFFDPWGNAAQIESLVRQHLRHPFRRQLTNPETLARLNDDLRSLTNRMASLSHENTRAIFARRQSVRPDDPWLSMQAAWHLLKSGDAPGAEAAAAAAHAHWPHRFDARALLALCRAYQDRDAQSGIDLIRPPGEDAGYFDVGLSIAIGRNLHDAKRYDDARPWLEYALSRDEWNSQAAIALAENLHRLESGGEAVELLKAAIERNPRNPQLWEELAVLYTLFGGWSLASDCFAKSEELAPHRYERLLKWAEALFRLRQYSRAERQINRYLAAMPDNPEAIALKAQIATNLPAKRDPEEDAEPRKPSRRFPWE